MIITSKKQFIFFCLIVLSIFGIIAFLYSKDVATEKEKPENQVKAFLHSIQKKTPEFFANNPKDLETPELKKLVEKNPQIAETFSQNRIKDINELKQKISDSIQRNWLKLPKTDGDKEKIKQVVLLLQGALRAEKMVGLKMNVSNEKLKGVVEMLPSLNAPTIAHLYNSDWLSVETVVEESQVRELIPRLMTKGAEGIIEYPLNKVI